MYILAMSRTKKDIKYYLQDRADKVYVHICKILLYPNSPYVDHWKHEIYAFISSMHKLKNTNKFPSKEFVETVLLEDLDNMIDVFINQAIADEDNSNFVDISNERAEQTCKKYAEWLAEHLASDGFVTNREVKEILGKICK